MGSLLPLLLLPVLMYFLLIRPQQKKLRAQQALVAAVEEGDEVMLSSGIFGFVTALDDEQIWVEVAEGIELRVLRQAISRRIPAAEAVDDSVDEAGTASAPGDGES
jgi:preprotein translocase subunit YajC